MTSIRSSRFEERLEDWLPPVGNEAFSIRCSEAYPDLSVMWARDHVHDYPTHMHDCVELAWIHSGWLKVVYRGSTYRLKAGDICIVAPNELHSAFLTQAGQCTFTMLHLPSHLYWSVITQNSPMRKRPEPFRILRYQALGLSINSLLETFVNSTSYADRVNLLYPLLEATMLSSQSFVAVRAEKDFFHPAVIHAREELSNRRQEPIELEEIARQVGLNMRYFISLFKGATGLPPHQYQIAMRVEKAREMLQTENTTLTEIACKAGFTDQSHFNRHFKRCYGFTPGAFKQILRPI